MKLKKLELCGFKTFPEPTQILFHDGITAVVGPNGCGKSNIIDAIRWVMGETSAKGLRGDSMSDVIFSGSDSRKPLNLAEVTLTLTEVEGSLPEKFGSYHEVSVTRRLHRSGDSEYLINKVPCRLKDITELFMDTGVGRRAYSMVEQGRIDAILSAKPEDRRYLIEEAAGITKYRARRDETRRKMDRVRQNLERIGDVIGEVRREMNALKRQASRAEAFRRLRAERRELERHRMVRAWIDLQDQVGTARSRLGDAERSLVEAQARAGRLLAEVEQARLRVLEEERRLSGARQGVYELRARITRMEEREGFLRREADRLAGRAREAEAEARDLGARRGELEQEIQALEAELRDLEAAMAAREGETDTMEAEHEQASEARRQVERALDEVRRELMQALSELTRVGHALDHAARQEADAARRLRESSRQEADAREKLGEVEAEIAALRAALERAELDRDEAVADRERLEEAVGVTRSRRDRAAQEAEACRRALQADQSRLQSLEQIKARFEWYGAGVREVLAQARSSGRNGVRGVVADILTAPPEYEAALEAALGERLQYVIVEDPGRGMEAVAHLKARRAGRSSFAPVDLREAAPALMPRAGAVGALGALVDLVEVAEGYEGFARKLLGDVFVVDTLEHALSLWQGNGIRATLVTLEGESVSPQGVISGGAAEGEQGGLLRKNREIRELSEAVERRRAELSGLEAALEDLERELEALAGRLDAAREEVHLREIRVVHTGRDLERLAERRERLLERCEGIAFEREALAAAVEDLARERERHAARRQELSRRHEELQERAEGLEAELVGLRERVHALHTRLTRHRVQEAADRQKRQGLIERIRSLGVSLENVGRRAERLGADARRSRAERIERVAELQDLTRELEALRAELVRAEDEASRGAEALDRVRAGSGELEREAAEARRRAEALREEHTRASLALRELELQAEGVEARFRERLGADLRSEAEAGLPEDYDPDRAEERIAELDSRLAAFGEVNLLAIEQYEERRERFEFLEAQREDLEQSLRSLKEAIHRINRESRKRFGETFERVSEAFRALYPRLFRGGDARLLLTDPGDLLTTGVDIVARPPGKRPQHISLLSGGEKALTAVALIFAIFQVKPSPFCLLDEVDAPLDEANIGRFTDLLRTLTDGSQFLVITHNRSTMEAADQLYGVTMPEPGVSKVISVRLSPDAPAEAA